MADSYIQVAADGSGKKMQTVKNTVGADEVHAEVVTLADTAGVAITTLPVSLATVPSHAVTNAGTFAVQAAQSGTWTVQPGNTANTTAWKVDASSVAVPITDNSGSLTVDGTVTGRIVGNAGAVIDGTVAAGTAPTNGVATLVQYKNTPPAPTDAQTLIPQADQAGNSRITYGAATATLSVWNSGTSVNATQTIYSNSGVTAATVMLQQSAGTYGGGAITFEVSFDGTNFVTVPSTAVVDPSDTAFALITLPYTLTASTNKPFLLINSGWQALRIKLSTAITGTGAVTPVYTLLPEAPGRPVTLISGPTGNKVDIAKVLGNAAVAATTGVLKVGISGNSGGSLDATNGATASPAASGVAVMGKASIYNGTALSPSVIGDAYGTPLYTDYGGNLRISPGMIFLPDVSWAAANALNSTSTIYTNSGVPACVVNLVTNSGTFTTGAITFEVSYDSTNWATIPADAVLDSSSTSLAQIALPYTLLASTTKSFLIINRGWRGLRIKLSTAITGASSPTLTISPSHTSFSPFVHVSNDFVAGTAVATNTGNASAGTQRVVLATDQAQLTNALKVDGSAVTQPTKEVRAATPTQSSVANNTGNVTLLAANSSRLGATIFNDDTAGTGATLKVKLGATASATSFTIAIAPQGYYEVPFNYTGIIDGIASAGTGNARITELAA